MKKNITLALALLLTLGACKPPPPDTAQTVNVRTLLSPATAPDTAAAVEVNGQPLNAGVTLRPGDTITITLPAAPAVVVPPAPDLPAPAGSWLRVASDNQTFVLAVPTKVRYGVGDRWAVKDLPAGTVHCNDGFGDPARGQAKGCQVFIPAGAPSPVVPPAPPPPPVVAAPKPFDPPLTITKGGTYTGRWASTDPKVAAVTVKTAEPVVIENCAVKGPGHLIAALWVHTRLTVRGCTGDDTSDLTAGRFLAVEGAVWLDVRDNVINGTAGIYLNSMDVVPAENRLQIIGNRAYDINGLKAGGKVPAQFVQLNHVRNQGGVIAWNRVENTPRKKAEGPGSAAEDVINLYDTAGTEANPIFITDNLIKGAFGTPPQNGYSGGGIMTGDGDGLWVKVLRNVVLETSNYGIAAAGGANIWIEGNTVLGLGVLPDGTILDADPDAGIYARNYSGDPKFDPAKIHVLNNTVGWVRPTAADPGRVWNYNLNKVDAAGNVSVVPTAALIAAAIARWEAAYAAR